MLTRRSYRLETESDKIAAEILAVLYNSPLAGHGITRNLKTEAGMSRKKRKRMQPGHFCWACGRWRPNEKFSGRGHARHLCHDCSKFGAVELAYRQALRNLERCMTWEGIIPRKRRKSFEQFLDHKDPRIRARAEEMLEEDRAERAYQRSMRELDEAISEEELSGIECNEGVAERNEGTGEPDDRRWREIPF